MKRYIFLLSLLLAASGCSTVEPTPTTAPTRTSPPATTAAVPFDVPDGFAAETLPYTFNRPTQFFVADDVLWVAQLNGGESAGQGQVLRIDLSTGEQTVVLNNLDKPTGIALVDDTLWVATRDALLKATLPDPQTAETVYAELPNNGRSNGTLTVTPEGDILFELSGNRSITESGSLWVLDPQTEERRMLAGGLKGPYAHAFDADGQLWITEIGDGSVEGVTLPGEINLVVEGADFGWPRCYGRELAGPDCSGVRPAVTVLPDHSTPTSVTPSPFAPDTLLVALWVSGEVVEIPLTYAGDNARGDAQPFLTNMQNPQHLITRPDDSLWVSDYAQGRIYRVYRQE